MKRRNLSIAARFTLTAVIVGAVIAFVATGLSAWLNINSQVSAAQYSLQDMSSGLAQVCSGYLQEKMQQAQDFAANNDVEAFLAGRAAGNRATVSEYLKEQLHSHTDLENIYVTDTSGGTILVDAVDGRSVGTDVSTTPFWSHRAEDKVYVDNSIYTSPLSKSYVFNVTSPIKDASGSVSGVVVLAVNWQKFTDKYVKNVKIGKSGYAFIVNREARRIYHPDPAMVLGSIPTVDQVHIAVQKKTTFQRYLFNDQWKYMSSNEVPESGWVVIMAITELELTQGSLTTAWISAAGSAILLLISSIFALLIARRISKPVTRFVATLAESAAQIEISSEQLTKASVQIASGAQEQASQTEETSSSMEELSSMVKQNVENAQAASALAVQSKEASRSGFDQMERMVESMKSIAKSTESIRSVIDVIDDIAFQTNMLALNAAVEAARAGEAGLGFAVVADEVKNLANRSAASAKETAAMIKESIEKIDDGMEIAKHLAELFKTIVASSGKVSEMSQEVEAASRQQEEGIEQINQAIVQSDSVVQMNASSSEETASAAEELQSQVQSLNMVVTSLHRVITGKAFETGAGKSTDDAGANKAPVPARILHLPQQASRKHTISFENDDEFAAK